MHNKWFSCCGISLSLILMALPCGIAMDLRTGQTAAACSYFSLTPPDCGNWFPMLAIVFALLALAFLMFENMWQMMPVCMGLSAASQLLAWLLFGSFTLVSATAVLLQVSVLLHAAGSTRSCRTT